MASRVPGSRQATDAELVADLAAYREMRHLDRYHHVVPALTLFAMLGTGYLLGWLWPGLHTSGPQMLVWGFCISTVLVYQLTFAVNSLGHRIGQRRFETNDASHNNWWLALATLGEGWHNNHHRFPGGARAGFNVWELDPTWLILRGLRRIGVVHDLRPVPPTVLADAGTQRRLEPAVAPFGSDGFVCRNAIAVLRATTLVHHKGPRIPSAVLPLAACPGATPVRVAALGFAKRSSAHARRDSAIRHDPSQAS